MRILFPPHPEGKILPHQLDEYERSGLWVVQRKFNGTHVLLNIAPDGHIGMLTRHGTPPKLFSLTQRHLDQIASLNLIPGEEYWLVGELLDHKTCSKQYKEKIVLFDVLQAPHEGKSRYLIRRPDQAQRLAMLADICRHPTQVEPFNGIALQVTQDIWMAQNWDVDFQGRFQDFITTDEIEGLVLRRKNSSLDNFGGREYQVTWMVRCRKPHSGKNYRF